MCVDLPKYFKCCYSGGSLDEVVFLLLQHVYYLGLFLFNIFFKDPHFSVSLTCFLQTCLVKFLFLTVPLLPLALDTVILKILDIEISSFAFFPLDFVLPLMGRLKSLLISLPSTMSKICIERIFCFL